MQSWIKKRNEVLRAADIGEGGAITLIISAFIGYLSLRATLLNATGAEEILSSIILLFNLIGYLLIAFSMRMLAATLQEPSIWNNAKKAVIIFFVGPFILGFIIGLVAPNANISWFVSSYVMPYPFIIVSAWYLKRALNAITVLSGIAEFARAGEYYWYGAWTYIIILGGIVLAYAIYRLYRAYGLLKLLIKNYKGS